MEIIVNKKSIITDIFLIKPFKFYENYFSHIYYVKTNFSLENI